MGALLISSLIIFPALSSMRVFKTFRSVTLCAAAISVLCFFVGVVLSYMAPRGLPTGASVVLVNVAVFLLFWLAGHLPRRSRKKAATALMMLVILVTLPGCGGTNTTADTITGANTPSYATAAGKNIPSITRKPHAPRTVEVKEKLFLTQMNEILANVEDYLGDTIQLEGMFTVYAAENGTTYYSVYRNSPGCCGSDGQTGFEVHWKKTQHPAYPKENDWVRAVGVLEDYDEDGSTYLRLALTSLTVQSKRGTEFVEQ
jgi:hypothetical protein